MRLFNRNVLLAVIPVILGASVAAAAPGKPYSDEWIEGRIQGALAYNTYLDSSDLEVGMTNGVATLKGTVASDTERDLAQQIASSVDGVNSVDNRIHVDPEIAPRSRPVWLQKFSDATTTAAVKSRLLANKNMQGMDIRIATNEGVVTLTGSVSSMAQKERAEAIARNTRDVWDVQSELKIADASTLSEKVSNASVDADRAINDSWLSSRIRSSLFFSSDFPGSSVRVNTNKGKVTLEGYARNAEQRAEIERSINDFVGVREVENNLKLRG